MKMVFSDSTRVAIRTANDFLAGKFCKIPDWAEDLSFFSRMEAGNRLFGSNMEIVYRDYTFFMAYVPVLRIRVEAVAFDADHYGHFDPAWLEYTEHRAWKRIEIS